MIVHAGACSPSKAEGKPATTLGGHVPRRYHWYNGIPFNECARMTLVAG